MKKLFEDMQGAIRLALAAGFKQPVIWMHDGIQIATRSSFISGGYDCWTTYIAKDGNAWVKVDEGCSSDSDEGLRHVFYEVGISVDGLIRLAGIAYKRAINEDAALFSGNEEVSNAR